MGIRKGKIAVYRDQVQGAGGTGPNLDQLAQKYYKLAQRGNNFAVQDEAREGAWQALKTRGSQHYRHGDVEPIDLFRSMGILREFAICNIIKYAARNAKPSEPVSRKDMEKIKHYADMLEVAYS